MEPEQIGDFGPPWFRTGRAWLCAWLIVAGAAHAPLAGMEWADGNSAQAFLLLAVGFMAIACGVILRSHERMRVHLVKTEASYQERLLDLRIKLRRAKGLDEASAKAYAPRSERDWS